MNKRERIERIERHIENLLVADAMIRSLHPKRLVHDLWTWAEVNSRDDSRWADVREKELTELHCGSAACFGGWVAVHPHFKAQGVLRNSDGSPTMVGCGWPTDVAKRLFGDDSLFDTVTYSEEFESGKDEKAIVLARIERALENRLRELGEYA